MELSVIVLRSNQFVSFMFLKIRWQGDICFGFTFIFVHIKPSVNPLHSFSQVLQLPCDFIWHLPWIGHPSVIVTLFCLLLVLFVCFSNTSHMNQDQGWEEELDTVHPPLSYYFHVMGQHPLELENKMMEFESILKPLLLSAHKFIFLIHA